MSETVPDEHCTVVLLLLLALRLFSIKFWEAKRGYIFKLEEVTTPWMPHPTSHVGDCWDVVWSHNSKNRKIGDERQSNRSAVAKLNGKRVYATPASGRWQEPITLWIGIRWKIVVWYSQSTHLQLKWAGFFSETQICRGEQCYVSFRGRNNM